jgi:hypothetical protein
MKNLKLPNYLSYQDDESTGTKPKWGVSRIPDLNTIKSLPSIFLSRKPSPPTSDSNIDNPIDQNNNPIQGSQSTSPPMKSPNKDSIVSIKDVDLGNQPSPPASEDLNSPARFQPQTNPLVSDPIKQGSPITDNSPVTTTRIVAHTNIKPPMAPIESNKGGIYHIDDIQSLCFTTVMNDTFDFKNCDLLKGYYYSLKMKSTPTAVDRNEYEKMIKTAKDVFNTDAAKIKERIHKKFENIKYGLDDHNKEVNKYGYVNGKKFLDYIKKENGKYTGKITYLIDELNQNIKSQNIDAMKLSVYKIVMENASILSNIKCYRNDAFLNYMTSKYKESPLQIKDHADYVLNKYYSILMNLRYFNRENMGKIKNVEESIQVLLSQPLLTTIYDTIVQDSPIYKKKDEDLLKEFKRFIFDTPPPTHTIVGGRQLIVSPERSLVNFSNPPSLHSGGIFMSNRYQNVEQKSKNKTKNNNKSVNRRTFKKRFIYT